MTDTNAEFMSVASFKAELDRRGPAVTIAIAADDAPPLNGSLTRAQHETRMVNVTPVLLSRHHRVILGVLGAAAAGQVLESMFTASAPWIR